MMRKLKGIHNLHQLMNHYFDALLVPESHGALVEDLSPCFFGQRDRVKVFITTMQRLVWEYNFVNQTFVHQYRMLANKKHLHDVFIFGGSYPLSKGQIRAIIQMIQEN